MKSLEEIKECKRLIVGRVSHDGGSGVVNIGGWEGSVVWSYGGGWDHVSVSPRQKRIIPSWDDMCRLKDIFFHDDEAVIQIHPPKSEYVNNVPNCLHLWKCQENMTLPPAWMVGYKDSQSKSEAYSQAIKELVG